ncbi:MAG: hypothetical protein IT178_06230 [Acidobacteria bacterium]|nr:hypothetical protein [Acidobacteriota bacterium]
MVKTVEAIIDELGNLHLLEPVGPGRVRRALVTVLEGQSEDRSSETALLSEAALGDDWDRSEEDEAWKHLQQAR